MLETLKKLIVDYVEVEADAITEDSRFIEDLGFNSYMFMSFLGEVEDEFDVEVDEQEILKLKTVGDAIEYIKQL